MKYFSQFKWAVSGAFADALGQCQFGEGDILHPKKSAYKDNWDSQSAKICLQVTYPPRQMNVPKEDTSEVFKKNWDSEVRIQKYTRVSPESPSMSKDGDLVISTQGRLYTSLWKGDLSVLTSDTQISMPTINAKEVVRLRNIVTDPKAKNSYIEQVRSCAENMLSTGEIVFAMPYDPANNVSNKKFGKISCALKDILSSEAKILTPEKAGIDTWKLFLPTVHIALFVAKASEEVVHERVKKTTYVKAKGTKTGKDSYDIRRHGIIFS